MVSTIVPVRKATSFKRKLDKIMEEVNSKRYRRVICLNEIFTSLWITSCQKTTAGAFLDGAILEVSHSPSTSSPAGPGDFSRLLCVSHHHCLLLSGVHILTRLLGPSTWGWLPTQTSSPFRDAHSNFNNRRVACVASTASATRAVGLFHSYYSRIIEC